MMMMNNTPDSTSHAVKAARVKQNNASLYRSTRRHKESDAINSTAGFSFVLLLLSAAIPNAANENMDFAPARVNGADWSAEYHNFAGGELPYLRFMSSMASEAQAKLSFAAAAASSSDDDSASKDSSESDDVTEEADSMSMSSGSVSPPPSGLTTSSVVITDSIVGTKNSAAALEDDSMLEKIARFLPSSQISATSATQALKQAAAATSLSSSRMFVRWNEKEAVALPPPTSWQCLNCNNINATITESCRTCAIANPGAVRLFFGQLRKQKTAEMTQWMINTLAPTVEILHIESHTNPSDGRGKGCAWVFVGSQEDAAVLLALHKRVFVDVNDGAEEGVWVSSTDGVAALADLAEKKKESGAPRPNQLPRQPMVVEVPKGSSGGNGSRRGGRNNNRHANNNATPAGLTDETAAADASAYYHSQGGCYGSYGGYQSSYGQYTPYGSYYAEGNQYSHYYSGSYEAGYSSPYAYQTPTPQGSPEARSSGSTSPSPARRHDPYAAVVISEPWHTI